MKAVIDSAIMTSVFHGIILFLRGPNFSYNLWIIVRILLTRKKENGIENQEALLSGFDNS